MTPSQPTVHYEVHITDHPDRAEIRVEPNLDVALKDAEETGGHIVEVIDFDD